MCVFPRLFTACKILKLLNNAIGHITLTAVELGNDLADLISQLFFALGCLQAVQQVFKGNAGIDNNGFHCADVLQGFIHAHRVINLKVGFEDCRARSGRTAQHLFKEDTGFNAAHKDKVGNFGNVNARCQQINGNDNLRVGFVLKTLDCLGDLFFIAVC